MSINWIVYHIDLNIAIRGFDRFSSALIYRDNATEYRGELDIMEAGKWKMWEKLRS